MRIGFKGLKLFCLIALTSLTSCLDREESEFDKQLKEEDLLIHNYLQDHHEEAEKTASGIYYSVMKDNEKGKAVALKDIISIKYKLSTLTGQFIDSAAVTSQGKPIRFQHVNSGLFPQGINYGVALMREGEKFRFFIPSFYSFLDYVYQDLIPANAILIAEVEVTKLEIEKDIKAQDKEAIQHYITEHQLENVVEHDTSFFYQTTSPGSGTSPSNGQQVEVAYKGLYLDDQVFDQSKENEPLKFVLGVSNVIPGFEMGIKLMKKGEKGRIFIPSYLAFGQGIQVIPEEIRKDFLKKQEIRDWLPFEPVIFEVELLNIN